MTPLVPRQSQWPSLAVVKRSRASQGQNADAREARRACLLRSGAVAISSVPRLTKSAGGEDVRYFSPRRAVPMDGPTEIAAFPGWRIGFARNLAVVTVR